jgi:hypothetical protein
LPARFDYSFARSEMAAPIVIDELADVAREYPIVVPTGSRLPVALLGVELGANAYVALDGRWHATYIPARIRQYPFALAPSPPAPATAPANTAPGFVVMLDEQSPLLSCTEGQPLFEADGLPAPAAQERIQLLEMFQARQAPTARLVQAIEAAGLLIERTIRIQRPDGTSQQVTGLRVINEPVLNQLSDASFNTLRQAGALPLIYASLLSWANFRQGPIGRSHPLETSAAMVSTALGDADSLTGL